MCGIAGIHLKDSSIGNPQIPLENMLDGLLMGIEHRGKDATGYVAVTKDATEVKLEKLDVPASMFIQLRPYLPKGTKTILGHTRLATQGDPEKMENNHPVVYGTCFATHNGVITNDNSIFRSLNDKFGAERNAEVDSIVIPALTYHCGMDKVLESDGLPEIIGSYAAAIVDPINNPNELLLVRGNSSPLVYLNHRHFLMWASTETALEWTFRSFYGTPPERKKFRHLPEGYFIRVKDDEVESGKYAEPRRSYTTYHYGGYDESSDDVGFTRFESRGASDNTWCYECGDRIALRFIEDEYIDGKTGTKHKWKVPVCIPCEKELDGKADGLTYKHSGAPADDDVCTLCKYYPASATNKDSERRCRGCYEWEKRRYGSSAGSLDDNPQAADIVSAFLSLKPGDEIPDKVVDWMDDASCEACGAVPVKRVDRDGFAVCSPCYDHDPVEDGATCEIEHGGPNRMERQLALPKGEDNPTLIKCIQCHISLSLAFMEEGPNGGLICSWCADKTPRTRACGICSTMTPKEELTETIFGPFCTKCKAKLDGDFEGDLEGAEEVEIDEDEGVVFFESCDGCGDLFKQSELRTLDVSKICDQCYVPAFDLDADETDNDAPPTAEDEERWISL